MSEKPMQGPGLTVSPLGGGRFRVSSGGRTRLAFAAWDRDAWWVFLDGRTYVVPSGPPTRAARHDERGALAAPMPGRVVLVNVEPGRTVDAGDVVVVLEAMKMELPIRAPRAGRVTAVTCRPGELVQPGAPLVEIE